MGRMGEDKKMDEEDVMEQMGEKDVKGKMDEK